MPAIRPMTLAMLAMLAMPARAADAPEVTPYRPSASNSAQLPTPGQLELEFGGLHQKSGSARDGSLAYLLKLAFTTEWAMLLGGDAQVWKRDDQGMRRHGAGDTGIVLKRAFLVDNARAFGLELGANMPTARSALGSGKADYTLNGIYSQDIRRLHLDINLGATRIGAPQAGGGRMETTLATAVSIPINRNWTGVAEWSGTRHRHASDTTQLLTAVSYSPDKTFAIDAGVARRLHGDSPDWSFFAGVVLPVARLW